MSFCKFCENLKITINDLCPQLLSAGMSWDMYWNEELNSSNEPSAIDYYLEKFKHEQRLKNSQAHLQATYFLKALQDVLQFKDPRPIFPQTPLTLSFDEKEKVETQEQIEADIKAVFANLKRTGGK